MIKQPTDARNVNDKFIQYEKHMIDILNEIFGEIELTKEEERTLVWLAGGEECTLTNIISAFNKAYQ